MTDLKALEQKHRELGEEIEKLKNNPVREMVGSGERYFALSENGDSTIRINTFSDVSTKHFEFGNMFSNQLDAEKHAKRLKVFNLLWDYARIFNKGEKGTRELRIREGKPIAVELNTIDVLWMTPLFVKEKDALRAVELIGLDVIKDAWS